MRPLLQILLVASALFLLSGCGAKRYVPLPETYSNKVISSDFVILQTQHEINAEIERSKVAQSTGGGLIPALIDMAIESSRASDAEDFVKPVRNALLDYNMEEKLTWELNPVLDSVGWLTKNSLTLTEEQEEQVLGKLLETTSSNAVGIIKPHYSLVPDFSGLKVTMDFALYDAEKYAKSQDSSGSGNPDPIYKNLIKYTYSPDNKYDDPEDYAIFWSFQNGKQIKHALDESIQVLINSLKHDLQNPSREK